MLIKLLKHEFRATARVMLPMYLVLLVTAAGANFTTRGLLETESPILNMLGALLVTAFILAILAACLVSWLLMVQRFYKSLLQDEGYVMMTLPVSVHQQVWSKLIVSVTWFAATVLVMILSFFVVVYEVGLLTQFFQAVWDVLSQLTAYYALNGAALFLELLALCVVGCGSMCLTFYAALAIGHSFANHKLICSVGIYFAIQFAVQMVTTILLAALGYLGVFGPLNAFFSSFHGPAAGHAVMVFLILLSAVYGAVFYGITTWFLKNRLNLE